MQRVAIIGGSGFIGTRLTSRLVACGYGVTIIDRAPSHSYPELRTDADVRDQHALARALSGATIIYNLAAVHRDDVQPRSLYNDINIQGAKNVCAVAADLGIPKIIFTSSVSVYKPSPNAIDESGKLEPWSEYGRSKLEAERVYLRWQEGLADRTAVIVRPTVVFGEGNRGNVFTLMNAISKRRFMMVGDGRNRKSLAYVENVAAFLEQLVALGPGRHVINYADKPDYDMDTLVAAIRRLLALRKSRLRIPYWIGYGSAVCVDLLWNSTGIRCSRVRQQVKKFCMTTLYVSSHPIALRFNPPVDIAVALDQTLRHEFLDPSKSRAKASLSA